MSERPKSTPSLPKKQNPVIRGLKVFFISLLVLVILFVIIGICASKNKETPNEARHKPTPEQEAIQAEFVARRSKAEAEQIENENRIKAANLEKRKLQRETAEQEKAVAEANATKLEAEHNAKINAQALQQIAQAEESEKAEKAKLASMSPEERALHLFDEKRANYKMLLETATKMDMHDPSSYEFVSFGGEVKKHAKKTQILLTLRFRGKNALGAKIITSQKLWVDPETDKFTEYTAD